MRIGLVLGAGGTVGLAYHAGALRALHEAGLDPAAADVIIGTSAGSVIGAYLRAGWSTEELWQVAVAEPAEMPDLPAEPIEPEQPIFAPSFGSPLDLARRSMGSAYVVARSLVRLPAGRPPAVLQRAFPGGMFVLAEGRRRVRADLPETWPAEPLWLCAVDIASGSRVVLGRDSSRAPGASLHDSVLASCAIPGVYPPVRIGPLTLVDGGAHSTTNLDLAVRAGCDVVIGIAPMAFDTASPPSPMGQLVRRRPSRQLAAEARTARRAGARVLLVRPTASEIRLHGLNYMRRSGWDRIARAAYDATSRLVDTERFHDVLDGLHSRAA